MISELENSVNFMNSISNPKICLLKDSCNLFVIKTKMKVVIQSAYALLTDCDDSSYNG